MTGFRWLADQFFQLPRWERLGHIAMLGIIFLSVVLVMTWPERQVSATEARALNRLELLVMQRQEKAQQENKKARYAAHTARKKQPDDFWLADINQASYEDLIRCGLSRYVARNLVRYVEKGGRIKTIEDARKLYGMTPQMLQNLLAHTRLDSEAPAVRPVRETKEPVMVDLNTADSAQLVTVKGIGGKTAQRILRFRQQVGAFHSLSQLDEIKGIYPETLEQIKQQLKAEHFSPFIHINTITEAELFRHLYFRKDKLSRALIAYREQHGPFSNAGDLKKCKLVTDEVLEKILPYIVFD